MAVRAGARVARGVSSGRGGLSARGQVSEMQRARLLSAALVTVEELGYARATVAHITGRARVSRRTFYDLFDNREDCLLAVMQETVALIVAELDGAGLGGLSWRERVRTGLWTILSFFDREPALARLCVVQSARGSQRVLERREDVFKRLADVVDEGRRGESARAGECPRLIADGLVGAAVAIVYKRLLTGEREPLSALTGDLMGMIVLPYFGPAVARNERRGTRTFSSGRKDPAGLKSPTRLAESSFALGADPLLEIPMRLTYRTARVLEDVAEHPGLSNRMVAEHAGISDQGQVSKLLARLERLGLLVNTGEGHSKGEPNAWRLTPAGVRVQHSIRVHTRDHGRTA